MIRSLLKGGGKLPPPLRIETTGGAQRITRVGRNASISVRGELNDEWKARGVAEGVEYSILTAEIARATFGVTPAAHSQLKSSTKLKQALTCATT